MSVKWIARVWDHTEVKGTALLVLLAIADHANDQGVCWPSAPTLAHKARCSERTVRRIVEALEAQSLLVIERRPGETSLLRLVLDPGHFVTPDKMSPLTDSVRGTPDILSPTPDIQMSDEPSLEPSVEPSTHASAVSQVDDGNFDEFWAVYPKKVDKASARRAWNTQMRSRTGPNPATVIEAARAYAASVAGTDPQYVKYPATWLRATDFAEPYTPPGARTSRPGGNQVMAASAALIEKITSGQTLQIGAS